MDSIKRIFTFNNVKFRIKSLFHNLKIIPRFKNIDLYEFLPADSEFSNNSNNSFNLLLKQKVFIEDKYKKISYFNFLEKYKTKILMNNIEEDLINIIKLEKDYGLINLYVTEFIKYSQIFKLKLNPITIKNLTSILKANLPNYNIDTLIYLFPRFSSASKLLTEKTFENEVIKHLNSKLQKLKLERNSTFNKFLENLNDNSILYYLIQYLNVAGDELSWNLFKDVLEKKIPNLDLNESISICIFLLETKILRIELFKKVYNHLNNLIEQIKNDIINYILKEKSFEIIFEKINALKLLLYFNNIEISKDFEKYLLNLPLFYLFHQNKTKQKSFSNYEEFIFDNQEKLDFIDNNAQITIIFKKLLNNLQINLLKFQRNDKHQSSFYKEKIVIYLNFLKPKNERFIKKFNNKKNPFDVFILLKLFSMQSLFISNLDKRNLIQLKALFYKSFYFSEKNLSWKLFFFLNLSNFKAFADILNANKNQEKFKMKIKIIVEMKELCFSKVFEDYSYIKNHFFKLVNTNTITKINFSELKIFWKTLIENFLYVHSFDKDNTKYIEMNKIILQDLLIFSEKNLLNKKDIDLLIILYRKYNLFIEEFKYIFQN